MKTENKLEPELKDALNALKDALRFRKERIVNFFNFRKRLHHEFSPCGNCWYPDIQPGHDRWVRFRYSRFSYLPFRRWSRPVRFHGEGALKEEPPPRPAPRDHVTATD